MQDKITKSRNSFSSLLGKQMQNNDISKGRPDLTRLDKIDNRMLVSKLKVLSNMMFFIYFLDEKKIIIGLIRYFYEFVVVVTGSDGITGFFFSLTLGCCRCNISATAC